MPSGLTAPTNDIDLNQKQLLFKNKCHVYYALGYIDPSDIPTTRTLYTALYSGTPKFKPLGDLAKDPIEINWEREELETHTGSSRGGIKVTGKIKSIAIHPDTFTLLDSVELDGQISILLVPFSLPAVISATDPLKFVAFSGVQLIDKGNINGNAKYGEVNLDFSAYPGKLTDCIKVSWIILNT